MLCVPHREYISSPTSLSNPLHCLEHPWTKILTQQVSPNKTLDLPNISCRHIAARTKEYAKQTHADSRVPKPSGPQRQRDLPAARGKWRSELDVLCLLLLISHGTMSLWDWWAENDSRITQVAGHSVQNNAQVADNNTSSWIITVISYSYKTTSLSVRSISRKFARQVNSENKQEFYFLNACCLLLISQSTHQCLSHSNNQILPSNRRLQIKLFLFNPKHATSA